MREGRGAGSAYGGGAGAFKEGINLQPARYSSFSRSEPNIKSNSGASDGDDDPHARHSSASTSTASPLSADNSPMRMSPWHATTASIAGAFPSSSPSHADLFPNGTGLVGSLVREEGHIYSLAASGGLLYTGSDSKNIRVWKNQTEFAGFKSSSGLVKAIVISSDRIFTGHQDGKIRVWRISPRDPRVYKRVSTLPRLRDFIKSSINPSNYVDSRRSNARRSTVWIRHSDAVSCLSINEAHDLLYSGSWDRTFKVWRVSDSKCLESVRAHDDSVNAIKVAEDGAVFTGSADGTVKMWIQTAAPGSKARKGGAFTRHELATTMLRQDSAVTTLAVGKAVYAGSSDGVVNFWEREGSGSGGMAHAGVLRGHQQAVLCVAAAGTMVFSGSADATICVWRREGPGAHVCVSVLTGHGGPVKCLAVEADVEAGDRARMWVVYSGSLDKSVKVWKVAEQASPEGFTPPPLQQRAQHGSDEVESSRTSPLFDAY